MFTIKSDQGEKLEKKEVFTKTINHRKNHVKWVLALKL